MVMEQFGLTEDAKTLAKNGYKEEVITDGRMAMDQPAARLYYIAQDNPGVQLSAKETCKSMSCPTVNGRPTYVDVPMRTAGKVT